MVRMRNPDAKMVDNLHPIQILLYTFILVDTFQLDSVLLEAIHVHKLA